MPAQAPPRNKLEWSNWWVLDREERWPNFDEPGGNVAGDGLFRILPGWLLGRSGSQTVTGYRIGISVDDAYTGPFPIRVLIPPVKLYRTEVAVIAGESFETIDLEAPLNVVTPPQFVMLPADGAWAVEVPMAPATIPTMVGGERAGIAIMVEAIAGLSSQASFPAAVLVSSFGERHFPPGQTSYSGSYDAATGQTAMFGTPGQPSAVGELYLALRFAEPTLQLAGDSAGGLAPDPQGFETQLGVGAYTTDLAARGGGTFGILVQAEQYDPGLGPPTHSVLPFLVATSPGGPIAPFSLGGGVALRIHPAQLGFASLLIEAGFGGPLTTLPAGGPAGFDQDQLGAYSSPRLTLPASAQWSGTVLWLQGLVVDSALQPVATTNVVRLTIE